MGNLETTQRNYTIDALRLICAFLVITLHFPLKIPFGMTEHTIARIAVPLFFMISGYFAYNDDSKKRQLKIAKQVKHIGFMTIASIVFYILYTLCNLLLGGNSFSKYILQFANAENIITTLLLNKSFLSTPLWFMYALFYTTVIAYFVNKFDIYEFVFALIPIFIVINLVFGCYSRLVLSLDLKPEYIRNCWFTGIPYYFFGMAVKTHNIPKIKTWIFVSLAVVFCFMQSFETKCIQSLNVESYSENYICTILLSVLIFVWSTQHNGKENIISKIGNKYSFYIYILQMAVGDFVIKLFPACRVKAVIIFFAGLLISVIYCWLYDRIKSKFIEIRGKIWIKN